MQNVPVARALAGLVFVMLACNKAEPSATVDAGAGVATSAAAAATTASSNVADATASGSTAIASASAPALVASATASAPHAKGACPAGYVPVHTGKMGMLRQCAKTCLKDDEHAADCPGRSSCWQRSTWADKHDVAGANAKPVFVCATTEIAATD